MVNGSWEGSGRMARSYISKRQKNSNLRYADDTTLLAETMEGLLELFHKVEAMSMETGLKIN